MNLDYTFDWIPFELNRSFHYYLDALTKDQRTYPEGLDENYFEIIEGAFDET